MDVIAMISQMEYSDTLSNKAALSQPILNIAISYSYIDTSVILVWY